MKGTEFLGWVMKKYPAVTRILVTGSLGFEEIGEGENTAHIYKCLGKPWDYETLGKVIREGYEEGRRNEGAIATGTR